MKGYTKGNKSKMNLHEHNKCNCMVCNSDDRGVSKKSVRNKAKKEIVKQLNK